MFIITTNKLKYLNIISDPYVFCAPILLCLENIRNVNLTYLRPSDLCSENHLNFSLSDSYEVD